METKILKPDFITEDYLEFLDCLRDSGRIKMPGARPYFQKTFAELSYKEASEIITYWMKTFSKRNK